MYAIQFTDIFYHMYVQLTIVTMTWYDSNWKL